MVRIQYVELSDSIYLKLEFNSQKIRLGNTTRKLLLRTSITGKKFALIQALEEEVTYATLRISYCFLRIKKSLYFSLTTGKNGS